MDDGGMNKRKRNNNDGAGASGAVTKEMAPTPKDDDDDDTSPLEAEVVPISSTEATVIGEGSSLQPPVEGDENNPAPDSAMSNETAAAAPPPPSHGSELETLDLISTIGASVGAAGGTSGGAAAAQGTRSPAVAAGDDGVLSPGMIAHAAPRAAPNVPVTSWGIGCPHCGVPTANVGFYPVTHHCLCHACRTNVDAVCPVCGLRGFFPCPGCGVVAAARRHYPVLHNCLCQACLDDD